MFEVERGDHKFKGVIGFYLSIEVFFHTNITKCTLDTYRSYDKRIFNKLLRLWKDKGCINQTVPESGQTGKGGSNKVDCSVWNSGRRGRRRSDRRSRRVVISKEIR